MRIFLTLCAFTLFSTLLAQKPIVVHGTPDWKEGIDISTSILFYEDKERTLLTLAQVQQLQTLRPYAEKRNERTSNSDVTVMRTWLKFVIQNTHPTDTARMVYNMGAHAQGFVYRDSQLVCTGGMKYIAEGYVPHVSYLDVLVPPHSIHTYWLQVTDIEVSVMPILAELHTQHSGTRMFADSETNYKLLFFVMSILVGCLLFMTLYSLYHFWLTRDTVFGYYAIYVASAMLITWLGVEGRFQIFYLSKWLKFNIAGEKNYEVISFSFVVPMLYILFVSKIIDIPTHFPRLWIALKIAIGLLFCQQLVSMYQSYSGVYFFSNAYYLKKNIVALVSTLLVFYCILRSKTPIKPYLITGAAFFIVLVYVPLFTNFFIPFSKGNPPIAAIVNLTMFWVFLGLTLEAICFAFALAYRSRLIEIEKNQMQIRYAQTLELELAKRTAEVQQQGKVLEEQRFKQLESVFEQRLAETEMAALRAQMNPHFIFNCLNSIKLYTLENDSVTASDYLSKFSRLIRMVLENSRSEKITLENELETLRLYIDMEAMRFKDKVKYKMTIDKEMDPQFVEIPPLLLQPYVENAIWHGLMHREGGGLIEIEVQQPEDNLLQITITDDGIGRQAAADLKSKSATKQKSLGLKMTTDRIELINQRFQNRTQVQILDLVDTEGAALGTKVIVQIPI
jgi:signal transduction histidine kinase